MKKPLILPRIRRLDPLEDGEVRLGDGGRGIIEGSLADDFQITAADVGRGDVAAAIAPRVCAARCGHPR